MKIHYAIRGRTNARKYLACVAGLIRKERAIINLITLQTHTASVLNVNNGLIYRQIYRSIFKIHSAMTQYNLIITTPHRFWLSQQQ